MVFAEETGSFAAGGFAEGGERAGGGGDGRLDFGRGTFWASAYKIAACWVWRLSVIEAGRNWPLRVSYRELRMFLLIWLWSKSRRYSILA